MQVVDVDKKMMLAELRNRVVELIALGQISDTTTVLMQLEKAAEENGQHDNALYINKVQAFIQSSDLGYSETWGGPAFVDLVAKGAFIDVEGSFLFVAPHGPRRSGRKACVGLTAIHGQSQMASVCHGGLTRLRWEGLMRDGTAGISLLPFVPSKVTGIISADSGEFFVPGDMWRIGEPGERRVPSLVNVDLVCKAAEVIARPVIWGLFDRLSAQVLTRWLDNREYATRLIGLEYLRHEYGHASGIGMEGRRKRGMFEGRQQRRIAGYALDESRADGADSDFVRDYLANSDEASDLVAVTLVIRMLDVIRIVRDKPLEKVLQDVDGLTALRWFERMIVGETLFRHRNGRLGLSTVMSWDEPLLLPQRAPKVDLVHVAGPMREWAKSLQQEEERRCTTREAYDSMLEENVVGQRVIELFYDTIVVPTSNIVRRIVYDS